ARAHPRPARVQPRPGTRRQRLTFAGPLAGGSTASGRAQPAPGRRTWTTPLRPPGSEHGLRGSGPAGQSAALASAARTDAAGPNDPMQTVADAAVPHAPGRALAHGGESVERLGLLQGK